MQRSRSGCTIFLLFLVGIGVFGLVLWSNSSSVQPIAPILPTEAQPTEKSDTVSQLLNQNFGENSTPLPTVEIPQFEPTRPIIVQVGPTSTAVSAANVQANDTSSNANLPIGSTPTLPPPTAEIPVQNQNQSQNNPEMWSIPALIPPLSRDPLGRDHYWFFRPIEADANSAPLFYYSYGSDGQGNTERVHHGIDIPNPAGEEVYATAAGTVVFASDRNVDEIDVFQNTSTYGNVVVLEHEFGYQGQALYTLYAHLQTALVTEGQYVQQGAPIGLVGSTGRVSGPHIHYEVRIAPPGSVNTPRYGDTYNPLLWMVPYVGHGVVAGRVVDEDGDFIDDITVTLRNRATGLLHPATGTTYVFDGTVNSVNADPVWRENFVINDVPVGRYDVITTIDGLRRVVQVDVLEGMTNFVELRPPERTPETEDDTEDGG